MPKFSEGQQRRSQVKNIYACIWFFYGAFLQIIKFLYICMCISMHKLFNYLQKCAIVKSDAFFS